ncbi:MAG: efflux RND transporter periplasmic adaptor subunit [Gemmatimonadales bacterium]
MGRRWLAGAAAIALLGVWGCNRSSGEASARSPAVETHDEAAPHGHAEGDESKPHEDADEAAPHSHTGTGGEAAGSITLSPEARANIGLQTVTAEIRPIERTLALNATLKVDPDHEAFVSSRVQGKVTAVNANVGDKVHRGQALVAIQSLQIAETPPTVEVTSPLDGVVLERSVTTGETVDPTKELFHVADQSHLLAQAEVYEADLAGVRLGQTARVRVAPFPDQVFTGRVVRLANTIDPDRRTLRIWIDLRNTAGLKLKPEMFAQADLVVASSGHAVAVPNEAIQTQGPERFVFVQNGDALVKQNVVIGERNDQYTAITSGVVEGDEVVTRGAVELATLSSQPAGGGLQDESKPHSH